MVGIQTRQQTGQNTDKTTFNSIIKTRKRTNMIQKHQQSRLVTHINRIVLIQTCQQTGQTTDKTTFNRMIETHTNTPTHINKIVERQTQQQNS